MPSFARPTILSEALSILSAGPHVLLAGGTDLFPAAGATLPGDVMDLTGISALQGITATPDGLRIGGCTTWRAIARADLPPALRALQQAAIEIGGPQIQNAGTIGGNLVNASPAADGVPPLLAVDAEVELSGTRGTRRLPLASFITGPRQTLRQPAEILTAVIIPQAGLAGRSQFLKLGARAHLVISIAMAAVRIVTDNGQVRDAAVAVGACSAVARRLPAVEEALRGASLAEAAGRVTAAAVDASLSPLDDLRATADYRRAAAAVLIRRAVAGALS